MGLFEIEEQVAVQPIDQRGGAEGTTYLGEDVEGQLALVETGEQAQGDAHGWVQVRTGNAGGEVDRHAYADAPNDADLPEPEAGTGDLERRDTAGAEEDEQCGAEKFGHALAGQSRLS